MRRIPVWGLLIALSTSAGAQTTAAKPNFLMKPERYFCWDVGLHFAQDNSFHLGYAVTTSQKSCVLGSVTNGFVAGLVFNPTTDLKGVFVNHWMNISLLNFGWSVGYETRTTYHWCFIKPQLGLGLQRFRITYGFQFPVFLNARTDTGGHTLSLAYSFVLQDR